MKPAQTHSQTHATFAHNRTPRRSGTLAFRERPGNAGTIVFLHGSGFCKEVFDARFYSHMLRGYRLISIDLPGHGASPNADNPATDYTYAGMADAVAALLDQLGAERCSVVGWSLGGHVALHMAAHSALVERVMTIGTAPVSGGPIGLLRSMHFSRAMLLAGKAQFSTADAAEFERRCLGKAANGRYVAPMVRTDPHMRPAIARHAMTDLGSGQLGELAHATIPICLVHGEHDPFIRSAYMTSLSGPTLFGGQATIMPECGHAPFLDKPQEFDQLLLEFQNQEQIPVRPAGAKPLAA